MDSKAQENSIASVLSEISDITFKKIKEKNNYEIYELLVKQPVDHSDPSKGYFNQKVYLSHKGFQQPTVMVTPGYNAGRNRMSELTELLQSNQIMVEHRYFGNSMPESPDFTFLNLKQATADLHKIKQIFATIYPKKWISTGISKGGSTTIFYRYFYPNDVDVSVPYVAPLNNSYEDKRIYDFLNTVGTDECRKKITDFQIRVLKNRDKILPLLKFYSKGARAQYQFVSFGEAFEYAVMEYPFSFWQWGYDCNSIPTEAATIEELTDYLINTSDLTFFSDRSVWHYSSHYYQAATEMGYYGYETSKFKEYLKELPTDKNPMALFIPSQLAQFNNTFNETLLKDTELWLQKNGNKFIYIYGEIDTWSATAVPKNDNVDAEWFMLKGKHHGNARIKSMTPDEKSRLISTLEKWLSIKIPTN